MKEIKGFKYLSQIDPAWSATTIGNTPYTLGKWGCTITCLSMLSSVTGVWWTPKGIAGQPWFDSEGRILWKKIDLPHIKFVERFYGRDDKKIQNAINDPHKAVILQVRNFHWTVALRKSLMLNTYIIVDSFSGARTTTRLYKNDITGGAIFDINV